MSCATFELMKNAMCFSASSMRQNKCQTRQNLKRVIHVRRFRNRFELGSHLRFFSMSWQSQCSWFDHVLSREPEFYFPQKMFHKNNIQPERIMSFSSYHRDNITCPSFHITCPSFQICFPEALLSVHFIEIYKWMVIFECYTHNMTGLIM